NSPPGEQFAQYAVGLYAASGALDTRHSGKTTSVSGITIYLSFSQPPPKEIPPHPPRKTLMPAAPPPPARRGRPFSVISGRASRPRPAVPRRERRGPGGRPRWSAG